MPQASTVIAREIRTIRTSFNRLARSFGRIAPLLSIAGTPGIKDGKPSRRRPRLTTAQRRALVLQGKYMGTMRGLSPAQRSRVKKIRTSRGIRVAIAEARRLSATR